RVALEPEGEALGIFRILEHGYDFLAELPGRHRREASQELVTLDAHGTRVGVGTGIADPGAADHLPRHDGLEADPEVLLPRDAVGVARHDPEHALGAGI